MGAEVATPVRARADTLYIVSPGYIELEAPGLATRAGR